MSSLLKTLILFIFLSLFGAHLSFAYFVPVDADDRETIYYYQSTPSHTAEWGPSGEDFFVNNKIYDPKTYCKTLQSGDQVKVLQGNLDDCVDAKFYVLRTGEVCNVWCE